MFKGLAREIRFLSFVFLIAIAGWNGVQQYITTFFDSVGLSQLGFRSLILCYLFFTLTYPVAAILVTKYGARKSMAAGLLYYGIFIVVLTSKSALIIYPASVLYGLAASTLWTGHNSYLVRVTTKKTRGTNAGFFSTCMYLGSSVGVFLLGLLIEKFSSFQLPFLFYSLFLVVGYFLVLRTREVKVKLPKDRFLLLKRAWGSKTTWRLSPIWLSVNFIFGLVIGVIPLEIEKTLGVAYVGLSSIYYVSTLLLSYLSGRLSDIKGRRPVLITCFLISLVGMGSLSFSQNPFFLIAGIVLTAVGYSCLRPIIIALVGDVSTKKNLEYLTAFFRMAQSAGVVFSLFLSSLLTGKTIFLFSIGTFILAFFIVLPVLRLNLQTIRERISQEVG